MKKSLIIFLLITLGSNAFPQTISAVAPTGQTLYYNLQIINNEASATVYLPPSNDYYSYQRPTGYMVIPSSIDYNGTTYTVRGIGPSALSSCTGLTGVSIPNSVTSIDYNAFENCTGLTSIIIPNSVTSIGSRAFFGCTSLSSLVIPNSVASIGMNAFTDCTSLSSLVLPNSVTSIGLNAFSSCSNLASIVVETGNTYYDSRNNCNAIIQTDNNQLLVGCSNTVIPNTVTSIGRNAFTNCTSLTSIIIPNSVTSIGQGAFSNCTSLTSIIIPNSVTSIGLNAFSGCSNLASIVVETGNTYYDSRNNCNAIIQTDNNQLLVGCSNTVIPNTVTSIGQSAFNNCTGLTSIIIPNSVTSIGDFAFYYCTGLTSIIIPNSVTSIGSCAFYNCTSLTSIIIPNSVTSIDAFAFQYCTSLSAIITLAAEAPMLGMDVFIGVSNNIEVHIPCGSLLSYSSQWNYFNNFIEGFSFSATSADENMGHVDVLTVPTCQNNFSALVYAFPAPNYQFAGWSDANSSNPRGLTLTSDTSIIAYFIEIQQTQYTISVCSNNTSMGNVSGSGTFNGGATTTISAIANNGYQFTHWQDGNTDNPRTITVTNNANYTAYFSANPLIHDTINIYDTFYVYIPYAVHDTTIINNWIHDTTYLWQYDTTIINNYIHDTTIVDNWIHDTTYLWQYDTTIINNYIHDTTFVDNWIHDTTYLWHYDTTIINNYIHDTTTVTLFDTIIITQYDTLMVTLIDTVTVTEQLTYHTLHVMSANNSQGLAAGNGTFPDGTNVEIAAIPIEGNRFVQWNDGSTDNPRTITVSSNMSFAASFEPADVAINSVEGSEYFVTTSHNMISVIGATGERIRLFDTLGRQLTVSNNAADIQTFAVPATGAYFIQIGNRPARKVVVVR